MSTTPLPIHVIGGGLAGSEAAWQIASAGVPVVLHEMRPVRQTEAHQTDGLAEMVCSNSFRSDDAENNAVGLLHQEMRALDSLVMRAAEKHRVPAGSALAASASMRCPTIRRSSPPAHSPARLWPKPSPRKRAATPLPSSTPSPPS